MAHSYGQRSGTTATPGPVGVLTKTIIQSPVVRWILHGNVRSKLLNDVVLVGDDFVEIKNVTEHGHLNHVLTKRDFDARIRAAKIFDMHAEESDEEQLIKDEDDGSQGHRIPSVPPHAVLLTLDSHQLLILFFANEPRSWRFIYYTYHMPVEDQQLVQCGEHLAVRPGSRVLAVAASEKEIILASVNSTSKFESFLPSTHDMVPVNSARPMKVDGVILQMDFLIPPKDDDETHNILLLIVAHERRTKAICIDWYGRDVWSAQLHASIPLDDLKTAPGLLIPLRNAAFVLTNGREIKWWKDILSGCVSGTVLQDFDVEPLFPGCSPRRPMWANWDRPRRTQTVQHDKDHIHLVREDGRVFLLQAGAEKVQASHVGDLDCHIGTAFASVGDFRGPDLLAVAGDMSAGQLQSIGGLYDPIQLATFSRSDAMQMELVETIPNWASVTDMVTSKLAASNGKSGRPRDGIFVTSGRQPYGAITELRKGLEAKLLAYFELDELRSVTDVWALPVADEQHVLLILSSPSGTRLLEANVDANMDDIAEVEDGSYTLDTRRRTLAAAVTDHGDLVQITDSNICVGEIFEDGDKMAFEDLTILMAGIDPWDTIAVTVERSPAGHNMVCHRLRTETRAAASSILLDRKEPLTLSFVPLCFALENYGPAIIAFVASADGHLHAFILGENGLFEAAAQKPIPASPEGNFECESIVSVGWRNHQTRQDPRAAVICALRDGTLFSVAFDLSDGFKFGSESITKFNHNPVKLVRPPDYLSCAFAMSGSDTCMITWDGDEAPNLRAEAIWICDKDRPSFTQRPVSALVPLGRGYRLSTSTLSEPLIMISGDNCLIVSLDNTTGGAPRQIPVSGTPNRLIYSEQQRCLIAASLKYEVRNFPSERPQSPQRRQIWPVIDFIPTRASEPSFSYDLQPGARVYALLEWTFRIGDEKTYSFVLVGGSYVSSSGSIKGKVWFLQPSYNRWDVVDVKESRVVRFDSPVYALALLDELTYVACVGRDVQVWRFVFGENERKWESICAQFRVASPGVSLSTNQGDIFVTTAEDGLIVLRLIDNPEDTRDVRMGNNDIHDDRKQKLSFSHRLILLSTPPRADTLLSHVTLTSLPNENSLFGRMALVSTKFGQVIGMDTSLSESSSSRAASAKLLFTAQLPRSLTRLRQCNARPPWKPASPDGVLTDNVLGCATDGSLVGVAMLDESLWRRLNWVQRLCEWSKEMSPHSSVEPVYAVADSDRDHLPFREERGMPIGLRGDGDEIAMRLRGGPRLVGHIDGDVIVRILDKGGRDVLCRLIGEAGERADSVGEWVRRHKEEELASVTEVIGILEWVLDGWL